MRRPIKRPDNTANFLGIGVGKKAKAKAQAEIDRIKAETEAALKLEQAKRDTLTLQLEQAKAGFTPEKDAQAAEIQKTKIAATSENMVYYILGAVALIALFVMFYKK